MTPQRRGVGFPGVVVGALVVVLVPCLRMQSDGPAVAPRRHEVEIRGFQFRPQQLEVTVRDTVVWINHDVVRHTATAADGSWDSGGMDRGASWRWVPAEPGAWDYLCDLHPTMKGAIRVLEPGRRAQVESRE